MLTTLDKMREYLIKQGCTDITIEGNSLKDSNNCNISSVEDKNNIYYGSNLYVFILGDNVKVDTFLKEHVTFEEWCKAVDTIVDATKLNSKVATNPVITKDEAINYQEEFIRGKYGLAGNGIGLGKLRIVDPTEDLSKPKRYNNIPDHYSKGIEPFEIIKAQGDFIFINFCYGNIIKYMERYAHKNGIEDLEKAQIYIDEMIKTIKKKDLKKENIKEYQQRVQIPDFTAAILLKDLTRGE